MKYKINSRAVVLWLGVEYIGNVLSKQDDVYRVQLENGIIIRCGDKLKFGRLLESQTKDLQKNIYQMKTTSTLEYIFADIELLVTEIGELQSKLIAGKNVGVGLRKKVKQLKDKCDLYRKESMSK